MPETNKLWSHMKSHDWLVYSREPQILNIYNIHEIKMKECKMHGPKLMKDFLNTGSEFHMEKTALPVSLVRCMEWNPELEWSCNFEV